MLSKPILLMKQEIFDKFISSKDKPSCFEIISTTRNQILKSNNKYVLKIIILNFIRLKLLKIFRKYLIKVIYLNFAQVSKYQREIFLICRLVSLESLNTKHTIWLYVYHKARIAQLNLKRTKRRHYYINQRKPNIILLSKQ